jgi:cold shock CspA family protein
MSVTLSSNANNVKRSWADIVKGGAPTIASSETVEEIAPTIASVETVEEIAPEEKLAKRSLQPAARGKYQCHCWGEVLVMLGHYGWIRPFEEIDHPDAVKTGGRIYVHKRDVRSDGKLVQGDVVSFYLYSDDQGLGAECCQVQERLASGLRADVAPVRDSPPEPGSISIWNPFATEFVPSSNLGATQFNFEAPEFNPSTFLNGNCSVLDFKPSTSQAETHATHNILAINPAFLSDDDSDDEGDDGSSYNDADVSDFCDKESAFDESDQFSEHDSEVERDDDFVVVHAPFTAKGSMSDGSTSVGGSSDSEREDAMAHVGLPPGLELPAGFRPPPGLSF